MSTVEMSDTNVWMEQQQQQRHLDWSDQQRRILTDHGNAELWYCAERGFPFTEDELPHYYLLPERTASTREIFHQWKLLQRQQEVDEDKTPTKNVAVVGTNPIVGIWKRTLFHCGSGNNEFTSHHDEYTFNIQTTTLFIDVRIPKTRDIVLLLQQQPKIQSLNDMNCDQLRYYARQHIFAGYTRVQQGPSCNSSSSSNNNVNNCVAFPYCATRYHCMDWNYVGIPRSRPNKWYIELPSQDDLPNPKPTTASTTSPSSTMVHNWKEWAYAKNQYEQFYYCEYWKRHRGDNGYRYSHQQLLHTTTTTNNNTNNSHIKDSPQHEAFLILRKCSDPDGMIIIQNDHIMYCIDRDHPISSSHIGIPPILSSLSSTTTATSLVAVVDELLLRHNDIDTARTYLSMQGGHGRWISDRMDDRTNMVGGGGGGSWILDHCIEFWKQGQSLFGTTIKDEMTFHGTSIDDCTLQWQRQSNKQKESWHVFDTSIDTVDSIRMLLLNGPHSLQQPPKPSMKVSYHHHRPKL